MLSADTTLILGAGASIPYGMPSGRDLRAAIIELEPSQVLNAQSLKTGLLDFPEFGSFVAAFRESQRDSIDSFIGQRPLYREMAGRAIAAILLHHESANAAMLRRDIPNNWYRRLFGALTEHLPWADVSFRRLAIITFNYDRTLEQFLMHALRAQYGVSEGEAWTKVGELRIKHVYGEISPASSGGALPYACGVTPENVAIAARGIHLMRDDASSTDQLREARSWILGAQRVAVLGFSFDALNIERIGLTFNTEWAKPMGVLWHPPKFAATCLGLEPAEAIMAAQRCGFPHLTAGELPYGFDSCDCDMLLRRTQILSA